MIVNFNFQFTDATGMPLDKEAKANMFLGEELSHRKINLKSGQAWDWSKDLKTKGIIDITSTDKTNLEQYIESMPFQNSQGDSMRLGESLIKAQLLAHLDKEFNKKEPPKEEMKSGEMA